MCNNHGEFEHFQCFSFETSFVKNENFFRKTGVSFLVESATVESNTFSYKTALPKANVKTNKMRSRVSE